MNREKVPSGKSRYSSEKVSYSAEHAFWKQNGPSLTDEKHHVLSWGENRMPRAADGENTKGREQSYLQGYVKAETKFPLLQYVSAAMST